MISGFSLKGVAAYILALAISFLVFWQASDWGQNRYFGWEALGVAAMNPDFFDLDTGCRAEAWRQAGHDPYTDGSYNAFGILANYSRALLALMGAFCNACGGSQQAGMSLLVLTVLLFGLTAGQAGMVGGFAIGLGLGFGGPALALERGNSDLMLLPVIAVLTWLPFWLERRGLPSWTSALTFATLLTLGALLKIFPAFALPALLGFRQASTRRWALGMSLAGLALYVLADLDTIRLLLQNTPHSARHSYGIPAFPLMLGPGSPWAAYVRWGLTLVATAALLWIAFRKRIVFPPSQVGDWPYILCLAGAGIYGATYFASASFVYRLVFVLFCLPYLFRQKGAASRWVGAGVVLFCFWPALLVYLPSLLPWKPAVKALFFLIRHMLGTALAVLALAWVLRQAEELLELRRLLSPRTR